MMASLLIQPRTRAFVLDRSDATAAEELPRKRRKTDASEESSATHRRKKACQTCSLRKVKCDAARPICAYCKSTKSECVYLGRDRLTLESATDLLAERLDEINNRLDQLQEQKTRWENPEFEVQPPENDLVFQPSKDFVQIPAQKTSADAVLTWPIFENRFPFNTLTDAVFQPHASGIDTKPPIRSVDLPPEERIPGLVDKFLKNVHTKNPILDVELLLQQSRRIASEGLDWDAHSCLVLLACALGSIAEPFSIAARPNSSNSPRYSTSDRAFQQAESYFKLASYRLGTLRSTLVGIQCQFYAGVYAMYTLRPLLGWQYFTNSSTLYQLYDRLKHGSAGRSHDMLDLSMSGGSQIDIQAERLEQCLYWSCFKSESEFRVELPLAMSDIGVYPHPELFPIPPTPQEPSQDMHGLPYDPAYASSPTSAPNNRSAVDTTLKAHAKGAYHEEESWYYYLTEIALRRIGNRIVNTFFRQETQEWLNIGPLLGIAVELDTQVSAWSANLPPVMQDWQRTDTIRDPNLGRLGSGSTSHVSQELSWAIENRLLEVRSWLYQPFVYYLVHHEHIPGSCTLCDSNIQSPEALSYTNSYTQELPTSDMSLDVQSNNQHNLLRQLIMSGIDCNLTILESRILNHRHHGLWFDLRSLVCASFILLAVIKSGHETWIPGGAEVLWGKQSPSDVTETIGGKLGRVVTHLGYWAKCCPEMDRHREVVEVISHEVKNTWMQAHATSPVQQL
ncbi:hypothetical protein K461DRAFT_312359 [Myriangium duriaei CBS 260.36]|uniref:Zn(2)-C6 fungal-type domain-containing protein n=1 Tax=Myriangium duriaei CBS 260.36 TaxID=1168546 RepID=A0A9P4MLR2_9PEZI|nr:hypothetical protein K461DRAFT_312359 [Myriangium duriaei CBS 260.36]